MEPIRKTILEPTNNNAPTYLEISILSLETGFDISRSMVPLSTIDVINDEADISEKNKIKANESERKPPSTEIIAFCLSAKDITPSTASKLTANNMIITTMA